MEIIPDIGMLATCVLMRIAIANGYEETDYLWAIYWITLCTSLPFFIQNGDFGDFLAEKYNTFFEYEKKTEKETSNEKI